jgi:hypothetical protein
MLCGGSLKTHIKKVKKSVASGTVCAAYVGNARKQKTYENGTVCVDCKRKFWYCNVLMS